MTSLLISAVLVSRLDAGSNYAAFVKSHPTYEVHVAASVNGKAISEGDLLLQRPARVLYKAHGTKFAYILSSTEKGYVEIENSRKIYDEYPAEGHLGVWESDISSTANALLPRLLFATNLNQIFSGKPEVTASGGNQTLYQKSMSQMGVSELWVTVAPDGRIISARRKVHGNNGTRETAWTFTGFSYPSGLGLSSFVVTVPSGYVPNSVPRLATPLQVGQPAPLTGWVDKRGAKIDLLNAAAHKPFLIAYVVKDAGPAEASLPTLHRLESKLPVFVVGPEGLQDPSGKGLKQLNPPGTPMFYLVGADGKVSKIWFGFDRADPKAFESDVVATAGGTPRNGDGHN